MAAVPAAVPESSSVVSIFTALTLLERWHACTRGGLPGLGIARRSVIGRMVEEGAQGASHATGSRPGTYLPPEVERVDRIIAKMPADLRDAVVADQRRDLRVKEICAKLRCTPSEFYRRRDNAVGFLAGMLTAATRD